MTWGVGTLILLFYNGVILGAVAADYIGAPLEPIVFGGMELRAGVDLRGGRPIVFAFGVAQQQRAGGVAQFEGARNGRGVLDLARPGMFRRQAGFIFGE